MRIGIIGAGMVGGTLVRRLTPLGHQVYVANSRGPDTLRDLAAETGAHPVTVHQAAHAGEVVIIAIPEGAVARLPKDLFSGVPADVIVIDANNYYPSRDGSIPTIERGTPDSAWVSQQLGRPVIKTFNCIYAQSLLTRGRLVGEPGRIALPVSGDPPEARAKILRLVHELGFDPVDAGGLDESWRHQPGSPCYTKELDEAQLKAALADAEKSRVNEYRAAADSGYKAAVATRPQS